MDPRPGDRIGNYRIERELGPTGSGALLHGRHLVLPRQAILKVLRPSFAGLQPYALQMLREACILEAIAHPGVPIVYESGVLRDRRPWFAFEPIAGPTLDELLRSGPLGAVEVAALLRDLADLLAHAHRRGVIHRGLVPDRIVLTGDRRFPLCIPDWSEAVTHDASAEPPMVAPTGSASYRAPELASQLAGAPHEPIDDRADMFALGAIGYRALTGRLPDAVPRAPLHELCPDAPAELAALVDSLLARDRFDRPTSSEVRADLDWLLDTIAAPAVRDREPAWARARIEPRPRGELARADGTGPIAGPEPAEAAPGAAAAVPAVPAVPAVIDQPRLRRPRWTPEVGYVECTPVEIRRPSPEDDLTNE